MRAIIYEVHVLLQSPNHVKAGRYAAPRAAGRMAAARKSHPVGQEAMSAARLPKVGLPAHRARDVVRRRPGNCKFKTAG